MPLCRVLWFFLNKVLTQKKGHITPLIRAILGPAAHHALRLRGLPRSSDLAKTGGRICLKDDFHRGSESNLITFPRKPHYKTLSTAVREAKGLPRSREERFGHELVQ